MKTKLLKMIIPISIGIMLLTLTTWGLVGCSSLITCPSGELKGSDGDCYSCSSGSHATYSYENGSCSNSVSGVYCCPGGGSTGCKATGCPSDHPWLCGGKCYATVPTGDHSCIKCP